MLIRLSCVYVNWFCWFAVVDLACLLCWFALLVYLDFCDLNLVCWCELNLLICVVFFLCFGCGGAICTCWDACALLIHVGVVDVSLRRFIAWRFLCGLVCWCVSTLAVNLEFVDVVSTVGVSWLHWCDLILPICVCIAGVNCFCSPALALCCWFCWCGLVSLMFVDFANVPCRCWIALCFFNCSICSWCGLVLPMWVDNAEMLLFCWCDLTLLINFYFIFFCELIWLICCCSVGAPWRCWCELALLMCVDHIDVDSLCWFTLALLNCLGFVCANLRLCCQFVFKFVLTLEIRDWCVDLTSFYWFVLALLMFNWFC